MKNTVLEIRKHEKGYIIWRIGRGARFWSSFIVRKSEIKTLIALLESL